MALTTARPNLLTDPGNLFWAPLGTALPGNAVTNGLFDSTEWAGIPAWVPMGATSAGSTFSTNTTINPIEVAEFLDPVAYRSTTRANTVTFAVASVTASNLSRAFNGAIKTVTGSTGTTLTKVAPVQLGQEVRCMLGWESNDQTVRWFAFQVVNSGDISLKFDKAPAHTDIPWTGMCEIPVTGDPWDFYFAGTGRA